MDAAIIGPINDSLRFGLSASFRGMPTGPRKARPDDRLRMNPEPRDSGSAPRGASRNDGRRDDGLFQIDIELIGAVAANQRQFQRGTFGIGPRRHAVEL